MRSRRGGALNRSENEKRSGGESVPRPRPPSLVRRVWWACYRSPRSLPVIFETFADARESQLPDEWIQRVTVRPAGKPRRGRWRSDGG